ncbi:hypothetical protein CAPTEDRAFT_205165 [Capitella teleta]|uniref:Major facilitator superfamily (MFS) profile domain-containing protein n=1 Tax=Capitella teleta TaxID=283909 RepID=R7UP07_CAPTE|nr:hypothetical protein CAPTEDRAFT_205165 [Capitella teleta]|eukprot:ELU07945.1 hypothetical protein CAPTEDRAFT_205165 [Capitella teleta]
MYALQTNIASEASLFSTRLALFRVLPPVMLTMVMVSYSDAVGRKAFLVLPCIGSAIKCSIYLVVEVYSASLEWLYLANLIDGICGQRLVVSGCVYAYLHDIVTVEERSFRFLFTQACFYFGGLVNGTFDGAVVDTYGYKVALGLGLGFYIFLVVYILGALPESLKVKDESISFKKCALKTKNAFMVVFKSRDPQSKRSQLIVVFLFVVIISCITIGNADIITVYGEGPPFCLSPTYLGYLFVIASAASVVLPNLVWKLVRKIFNDSMYCIIVCLIGTIGYVLFGLCNTSTELFIVIALVPLPPAALGIARAIMTYIVESFEQSTTVHPL